MGTNYYWHEDICPHCKRTSEPIHIGKSSGGWCFALHILPELGITTLEDWQAKWKTGVILDEYNSTISPDEMLQTITNRSWNGDVVKDRIWWDSNKAEPGPNNLARSKVDGRRCVGHGEGTWDYFEGEFC